MLMVGFASAAIYSVLVPISEVTGLTLNDLNADTGYMLLFFGWGCLVWQPLALQYGKQPGLFRLHHCHHGYKGVGASHQNERPVDRKQDPARVFRGCY
jgi:hypothetical protein